MAFNRENFARLKEMYERKNLREKQEAEGRIFEVSSLHPDFARVDRELSMTGVKILKEASRGEEADLSRLRAEVERLHEEKLALLRRYGYPEDYCDVHYECEKCRDTGYADTKLCDCFRRALVAAGYESSGIGALIRRQSFDNFRLDYYASDKEVLRCMRVNLSILRSYAEGFSGDGDGNLLLVGGTGLGKTHLSTAVAKVLIERGFDVLYESAPNVFSDFEHDRFPRDGETERSRRYFDCEMLILDDLGTEASSPYTLSCLYNLVNTRLNRRYATIINTNLSVAELSKRYTDRLTSRLVGEYRTLVFRGKDIRLQKLSEQ